MQAELGVSPAKFVESIRLDAVRLSRTARSISRRSLRAPVSDPTIGRVRTALRSYAGKYQLMHLDQAA
jgi:hypothetical protein